MFPFHHLIEIPHDLSGQTAQQNHFPYFCNFSTLFMPHIAQDSHISVIFTTFLMPPFGQKGVSLHFVGHQPTPRPPVLLISTDIFTLPNPHFHSQKPPFSHRQKCRLHTTISSHFSIFIFNYFKL